MIGGPEAGGIRGEDFIDEDEVVVEDAEFEFGIGDDDASFAGVSAGLGVDLDTECADAFGDILADDAGGFFEGDIFVVPGFGFRGGGEDGFGEFGGFLKSGGEGEAADCLAFAVFLPAGAGEVAAHDAFDGEGLSFFDDHAAALDCVRVGLEAGGQRIVGEVDAVIGYEGGDLIEPKVGDLREDLAFSGDAIGEDDIERGDPVGSDHEVMFAEVEHFADFAAFDFLDSGQVELEDGVGIGHGRDYGGAGLKG
ncbi:MAG: hypothetical protein RI897_3060 [Verrucomicrobiota bacterium]